MMKWAQAQYLVLMSLFLVGELRAAEVCDFSNSFSQTAKMNRFVAEIESVQSKCFNPEEDVSIQKYLYPNLISSINACNMHETKEVMHRMHQTILKRSKELGMDPRLVYIRLLGESGGNPYVQYDPQPGEATCPKIENLKTSKTRAFGLFQFLGGAWGGPDSFSADLLKLMKQNEMQPEALQKGVREIQVEYYLNTYVQKFSNASMTTACKKEFKDFTNLEKLAYLGAGNCKATGNSEALILNNSNYANTGAKRIYEEMKSSVPVCEVK